ncbi:squalene/phytoene synthase family protein [Streptomyces sp. NPDC059994]|uniref:squalene/phytoene synthase family protein n=1 Tax=Streptomyces sp. NPDC059994 TaxID=3347029 RepID=UPI00367CC410
MPVKTWRRTLDLAAIDNPRLRHDYTQQRHLVARFARAEYTAVRLLLPAPLVPPVLAATAFMHHTDDLIDTGSLNERLTGLADWSQQVRAALDSGISDQPVLRAMVHTVDQHPHLRQHIDEFLAGGDLEARWKRFDTEADFQHYIDAYSLPAFMLIACQLGPCPASDAYIASCRAFIEAGQRLDFLEDLAEDLQTGRIGIPEEAFAQHDLTSQALHRPEIPTGVKEALHNQIALMDQALNRARGLADLAEHRSQPLLRALLALQAIRIREAGKQGTGLLRKPPRKPLAGALRILAKEYPAALA